MKTVGMGVVCVLGLALVCPAAIIDENFTGGTFEQLGWVNANGGVWTVNNAAGRAEYTAGGTSGWFWIEKSFDPSLVANGWQLDFDYEWQWGGDRAFTFIPQVITSGYEGRGSGYGLFVHQMDPNGLELMKMTDAYAYSGNTLLAAGAGYNQGGCGYNPPNWKAVRLTWDAATHTLTAYKKVDGAFVEVASAVDSTYATFDKVRFNMYYTAGETLWITNVHLAAVPEPTTMSLLGLGVLAMVRRRYNG